MRCDLTAEPATFEQWAREFLMADPFRCGVIMTNVVGRRIGAITDPAPATYAVVRDAGGDVVGAAMRTPPQPIFLSPMPDDALVPLVEALGDACPDASGVTGPDGVAGAFAMEWGRRRGAESAVTKRQRVFRLDRVDPPRLPVAGGCRAATAADRAVLLDWEDAFGLEAEGELPPRSVGDAERLGQRVDARIGEGRAFLWELDRTPVSYVGSTMPVAGVARIGPVYTPPEHRGNGYASALVAAVSRDALDAGALACALFTDLANPTSNKIYQAIGYRPVSDVTRYAFRRAPEATHDG